MEMILIGMFVSGGIGYLLGMVKGNGEMGAVLGTLLGPLGWVMILFFADGRPQCPECKGRLPKEPVTRCCHCGCPLRIRVAAPGKAAKIPDAVDEWEAKERAKVVPPVPKHLRGRRVDEE